MGVVKLNKTVIFRPFFLLQIPKIEEWLKQQSAKGYRLISYQRGRFTFAEVKPKERDYFVYISPVSMKNDAFLGEFYRMKRLYGERNWKIHSPPCCITEIRTEKMDSKSLTYVRLSRNTHYKKHYLRMLLATLGTTLLSAILTLLSPVLWLFPPVFLLSALFSAVSLGVLHKQYHTLQKDLSENKHCE